jgi:hypothetical protein
MMLDDIMQQGATVAESLSSLCTMLVVMDPAEANIPVDRLVKVMKDSLQEGLSNNDGDVVVLCMRATGILLEGSLKQLKRHHAVTLPFLVDLFNAAMPMNNTLVERDAQSSQPISSGAVPKRRRSTSTPTAGARVPEYALVYSSSRPHELGEETLRCLPIVRQVPAFAAAVPSVSRQAALCSELSRSAAPTPVIETSLTYLSSLVRSCAGGEGSQGSHSAIAAAAGARCIDMINSLAATCDFSPQWDSLLCAATQLALVVKARLARVDEKRLYADAYLRLCVQSMQKNPAPQRLALIAGCTSSVVSESGLTPHDVAVHWDLWIKHALDLGASNASAGASLKIGNPFVSSHSGNHQDYENDEFNSDDDPDGEDDEDDDGLGRPLPSRSWVAEDAKVSILFIIAHGLFGCTSDNMRWKFTAAWRDDEETYRRYPTSVARDVVSAYLRTSDDAVPLPHISSHHSVLLNSLLQTNSHTSMLRPVFLQPIPTLGCTPTRDLQFPSAPDKSQSLSAVTSLDLEAWLRILQPYCAATDSGANSKFGGAKTARACSILANGIIFYLFTEAGTFDAVLAEKISWSLQSFFSSDVVDEPRKVTLIQALVKRDTRWGDVLSRCGAVEVLQAASASSHHPPSAKKHRAEPNQRVHANAATAKAVLSQLGSTAGFATATQMAAVRIDDFSQCSEELLSILLVQEQDDAALTAGRSCFDESTASASQLSLIMSAVADGTVAIATFRKAMLRAVERSLAASSSASSSQPRKLTKEQCDRNLAVNICVPNAYAALQCPQSHPLRVHHSTIWTCNKCARHFPTGSLACRSCDYDLCQQCVSEMQPNRLDVSHCLTMSDVLRYIRSVSAGVDGEQPPPDAMQHLAQRGDILRHIIRETLEMRRVMSYHLNDASRALLQRAHTPTLSMDPVGAMPVHASLTVQQAQRRYFTGRKAVQLTTPRTGGGMMVHIHDVDKATALPLPCTCAPVAKHVTSPYSTPRMLPIGRTSPRHSPQQTANGVALPALAHVGALEALVKSCSGIKEWGVVDDASSAFSLNQLVVAQVRNHAPDVFFLGLDGLPKELLLILSSNCRTLVDVPVRMEVMRFCGAECRRAGLLHMFANNVSVQRGHVPLTLNEAPVPTKVCVSRSDDFSAMMSSIDEAFLAYPTVRSKVEFSFAGEVGTGDGPTQELYTEVSIGCTAAATMWWHRAEDNALILFPSNQINSTNTVHFRALGACFARSFIDNFTMSIPLEPAFWTLVIAVVRDGTRASSTGDGGGASSMSVALNSVAMELEPILHKSLMSMKTLSEAEIAAFDMTFADEITIVAADNIDAYVEEVIAEKFVGPLSHAKSFVCGFGSVLDPNLLFLIDPSEASTVFCGGEQDMCTLLTEELLRRHIVGAHGYTSDSSELQWLIHVVATMDKKDQCLFVEFLTGSPRLPVGGLAGLNRSITVAKKDFDCGQQTLPSCNTCFLYLKVPPYKTESQLKERLLLAIREGRRNFSLS